MQECNLWSMGERWDKMAPTRKSEAYVHGREGLGVIRMDSELNLFFSSTKAASALEFQ